MTSSRSKASRSKRLLVLLLLLVGLGSAEAGSRRRVVILPFPGDKAAKFHKGVVRLVKRSHTVVSERKWKGGTSAANVKRLARKLKVDGVIEGKIQKRRGDYILRFKIHAGTTGKVAGSMMTKSKVFKLDAKSTREIKDELIAAIDELDSIRGGGDDDEDRDEETADDGEDEGRRGRRRGFGRGRVTARDRDERKPRERERERDRDADRDRDRDRDDDDADDGGSRKGKARDRVAARSDDDDDEVAATLSRKSGGRKVKMDRATALSPGNRAIDAAFGLSLLGRRLAWKNDGDLAPGAGLGQGRPPSYKGLPAPGALLDLTAYPLAFGHNSDGMLKNLGVTAMYDQALLISSKDADGTKLDTAMSRFAIGAVFRYPLGKGPRATVVGAHLRFGSQKFEIAGNVDIPNVNYSIIDPGLFLRMPVGKKMFFNATASYLLISKTGDMQLMQNYGNASVNGIDTEVGGDYQLSSSIFARAALRFETIGHTFDGDGALTTGRDGDAEQDVQGARDTYFGATVTLGYAY